MAGRRSVLHGASDLEREERANQQREYAALLQEQIRQKNARQDADKARRRQEQQAEREDRGREPPSAKMSPPRSPQQTAPAQPYQDHSVGSIPEASGPPPTVSGYNYQFYPSEPGQQQPPGNYFVSPIPVNMSIMPSAGIPAPYAGVSVAPFTPMPHVFEPFLREPSPVGVQFNDSLAALNRLTTEIQSLTRQRQLRVQSYVKPSFMMQEETHVLQMNEPREVVDPSEDQGFEHLPWNQKRPEAQNEEDRDDSELALSTSARKSFNSVSNQADTLSRSALNRLSGLRSSRSSVSIARRSIVEEGAQKASASMSPSPPKTRSARRIVQTPTSTPRSIHHSSMISQRQTSADQLLDDPALLRHTHSEMLHFEPSC